MTQQLDHRSGYTDFRDPTCASCTRSRCCALRMIHYAAWLAALARPGLPACIPGSTQRYWQEHTRPARAGGGAGRAAAERGLRSGDPIGCDQSVVTGCAPKYFSLRYGSNPVPSVPGPQAQIPNEATIRWQVVAPHAQEAGKIVLADRGAVVPGDLLAGLDIAQRN